MQAGKPYQGSLIERKSSNCKPFSPIKRIKLVKKFRRIARLSKTIVIQSINGFPGGRRTQNWITERMLLPWCIRSKASLIRSNGSLCVIIGSSWIAPVRYFST